MLIIFLNTTEQRIECLVRSTKLHVILIGFVEPFYIHNCIDTVFQILIFFFDFHARYFVICQTISMPFEIIRRFFDYLRIVKLIRTEYDSCRKCKKQNKYNNNGRCRNLFLIFFGFKLCRIGFIFLSFFVGFFLLLCFILRLLRSKHLLLGCVLFFFFRFPLCLFFLLFSFLLRFLLLEQSFLF